jgi:RNA polymerase sigma factor (sigma-70 family)
LTGDAGELWDVLGRLSEDQRVAVVLPYYGGYRSSEIAKITDLPAATVRSDLRRARAAIV